MIANGIAIAGILAALMLGGCSNIQDVTARTFISYGNFVYDSHKDQNINAEAEFYNDGKPKKFTVKAIAMTPQAAMAALVEMRREEVAQMRELISTLSAIAKTFAPVPLPSGGPTTPKLPANAWVEVPKP